MLSPQELSSLLCSLNAESGCEDVTEAAEIDPAVLWSPGVAAANGLEERGESFQLYPLALAAGECAVAREVKVPLECPSVRDAALSMPARSADVPYRNDQGIR